MATTTLFALSNPGGKRVRLKSRKATMARRRRRGRRNPSAKLTADEMEFVTKRLKRRKRSKAAKRGARRRKRRAAALRRKAARRAAARKAARTRARRRAARRASRRGVRRGRGRRARGRRRGRGRRRRNPTYGIFAPSWATGKPAKRRKKRKASGKKKAARRGGKRKSGGRKAARRGGSKKRKAKGRRLSKRPRKGIYRPYARVRGRRPRFGARTKARMAALGLATKRGEKYTLNPRRRRKARRNPVARRRRSRRRRNPMGIVRGVKGLFTKAKAMRYARLGLGAMLGMAAARQGPAVLASLPVVGQFLRADSPLKALALSAAAIGAAVMVGRKVRVPSDILAAATVGGAGIVAAGVLKLASQRVPVLGRIPGVSGMGDVVSPSQLVAGEAIFGGSGMGDYLQLSGPVPEQYFAGGLNDYVEFQNRAAGVAAEAASAAQVDWSPGTETSF